MKKRKGASGGVSFARFRYVVISACIFIICTSLTIPVFGKYLGKKDAGLSFTSEAGWALSAAQSLSAGTESTKISYLADNPFGKQVCVITGEEIPLSLSTPDEKTREESAAQDIEVAENYGKLPLYFIRNDGQVDEKVKYYEKGSGHSMYFTGEGVYLSLRGRGQDKLEKGDKGGCENPQSAIVKLIPLNANKHPEIVAEGLQEGKVNYFIGNNPEEWRTNIPTYSAVVYKEVWPGIDIKFYGNNRQLEYDVIVKPGIDPSQVRFAYEGIEDLRVNENGELEIIIKNGSKSLDSSNRSNRLIGLNSLNVLNGLNSLNCSLTTEQKEVGWALPTNPGSSELVTEPSKIIQKRPYIYQEIDGKRVEIEGRFEIHSPKSETINRKSEIVHRTFTYGFHVAAYDTARTLVIDPVLEYSTYLGGSGDDRGYGIAVDGSGTAYVTGLTASANFPIVGTTTGKGAGNDAFVTKLGTSGSSIEYSTYLGGSGTDEGNGIAVDSAGFAYITGYTSSNNFPIMGTTTGYGGNADAFVTKLGTSGSSIEYSTYLGGNVEDKGYGIAVDSAGSAYVTGFTKGNFPIVGTTTGYGGGTYDAFVTKLGTSGGSIEYSTYLGGNVEDKGYGIAVDSAGSAYVTGHTASNNFPIVGTTTGYGGGTYDAFVTKLDTSGSSIEYSTYLGGSGGDYGYGIAVDSARYAYVTGFTASTNFPIVGTTTGYGGGMYDAFVTKLGTSGSSIEYSTYLGGSNQDYGAGIAVDGSGYAYVSGQASSANFPIVGTTTGYGGGISDAFVTKLGTSGGSIEYSTYLGGSSADYGYGIAVDSAGSAYVTGHTASTNFPIVGTTTGYGGGTYDAFVTKITFSSTTAPTVTTGSATDITGASATLNSMVNANGLSTTAWFDYGTSSGSYTGTSTTQAVSGTSATAVSIGISGLSASTTYYYRIAASNSAGTSTGSEASFTTSASSYSAPTVMTGSATSVTMSTAMLNATIIPNGTTTTVWFQYGASSGLYTGSVGTITISTNLDSGTHGVISTVDGLTPWTTYYYRAVGQNSGGTTYGSETSFTPMPQVAGGYFHTVALKTDGTVWAWGRNDSGQLGNGTYATSTTPVQVSGLTGVIAINAGDNHSVALKSDGTVWAWGSNDSGQLGNGTYATSNTPVQVSGLSGVLSIEGVGAYHNIVIGSNTSALAWGDNYYGQLGNGTTTSSNTSVQVSSLTGGVEAVWGGIFHSLALVSSGNGNVYTWGWNDYGQLGDGTTTGTNTPSYLSSFSSSGTTTAIRGGWFHSLALRSDGTVWAWGRNLEGQLGTSTTTGTSTTPIQVTGISGVSAIAIGDFHSVALKPDGTVWSWGGNSNGQLGDGSNTDSAVPVQTSGLSNIVFAGSANGNFGAAIKSDGTVWTWGDNYYGQLGNGTTTDSNTPVQVYNNFNLRSPTVTTSSASGITSSSATLNGTVNANGTSTTAWFNYGATSGSYTGTSSTQSVSGTSSASVSIGISGLSASTTYYYRIAASNSAGTSTGSEASFTTSSSGGGGGGEGGGGGGGGGTTVTAPTYISVNSVSPTSGASNVSTGATISATFSDTINGSTVSSSTFKVTTGGSSVSGSLSTSGSKVTFTPSSALSYNATYTVTLTTGIKAANAAQSSLSSDYSWSFTTASPADSGPPSGSIVINNGNEYTTSTGVTLSLSATDDIGVTGYYLATGSSAPSLSDSGWVSVTSATTYSGSVSYTLTAGDGNKTLYAFYKDAAGNISAAASDSITLDTTPPAITVTEPANNATGVATDIILTATFSENMDASTIGTSTVTFANLNIGTITYSGTSTTATVTFTGTLQYATTYNGTITTGVKDIAGNAMASGYGWRFTTVGETAGTATPSPSPTGTATPSVTPTPISGYGAISGIVTDDMTGIAVAGATVETDIGGYGTATGLDGRFLIAEIPAGEYLLTAFAEDYHTASETVIVENAGTSSISFSLMPSFLVVPTPSPTLTVTPTPTPVPTLTPVPSPTPTGKPLEADFEASPVTGKQPLTVQFTDASIGEITSWKWDFGDGNTSTKQNPSNTYQKKGNYTVSLRVKSKDGKTDTASRENYITILKEGEIMADFTADTTSGLPPLEVQFTEQCFGEITSYKWDFGDGSTSTEQNPKHTYTASGEYTVSLTAKGSKVSDTKTKTGYVKVEKKNSEITVDISSPETSFGSSIALSGQITPAFETTVTMSFTHSNGEMDTKSAFSDKNGQYTLNEYFPPSGGKWEVVAGWNGNDEYKGAKSPQKTFTVSRAEADFTIEASAYETEIGKTIDITGVITLTPDNETTRSKFLEERLKLIRINPDEEYEDILETQPFLSDNNQLQYTFSGVTLPVIGEWEILAGYDETDSFKRKRSESINVTVKDAAKEVAGYAIIVQGRVKGESGIDEHNRTTNYVYNRLKDRGFTDDNIYYFNYNTSQNGVDKKPSHSAITDAIKTWASGKMNKNPAPLFIILAGHGKEKKFLIYSDDSITANDLSGALDKLESKLNEDAQKEPIVIIIGANRSGSFIKTLSKTNTKRILITSCDSEEISYKGPLPPDETIRHGDFFVKDFISHIADGRTVKRAYELAAEKVAEYTENKKGNSLNGASAGRRAVL